MATAKALSRLLQGFHYKECASEKGMKGNSPVVRAVAIGLAFSQSEINTLKSAAIEQTLATHSDPTCQAGAVAVALTIRECLQCQLDFMNVEGFLEGVALHIDSIDPDFALRIRSLPELLKNDPGSVVGELACIIGGDAKEGVSGHAMTTVLWSLYCFLRSPSNFWEILATCISGGGDVDSTSALSCAFGGAYLGFSVIPHCVQSHLQDQNLDNGTRKYFNDLAECIYQFSRTGHDN